MYVQIIYFLSFTVPDDSPQNVTATAVSSTEIEVSWEEVPAIDENGIIVLYEIQFVPLETFDGALVTETVNTSGPVLTMNLTGLQEYVEYSISVRAYTSVGPGPYSDGAVERTEEDGKSIILAHHLCIHHISLSLQCLMLLHRM